ncbi:uncharacterized protein METZ01_LOCUS372273 [marine metagenome]|uniref:Uncharacterized protein n=1 Tax=marine metagenome TaxID=408172 RepID=A0A382TBC0_9ZZZZ
MNVNNVMYGVIDEVSNKCKYFFMN